MDNLLKKINYFLKNISFQWILKSKSTEKKFTWVYQANHWGSQESKSGQGSTLIYTENLRKILPILFNKYQVKKIFDAPCGDFNWMKKVLSGTDLKYIGADIVEILIKDNNINYSSDNIRFLRLDLTKSNFPNADLMLCRDCLFHLSFSDAKLLLENYVDSNIPYLLTSTHTQVGIKNYDIETGDFRLIDLYSAPYNFPSDPIEIIEDWVEPYPQRNLCLWTRDQVIIALAQSD